MWEKDAAQHSKSFAALRKQCRNEPFVIGSASCGRPEVGGIAPGLNRCTGFEGLNRRKECLQ